MREDYLVVCNLYFVFGIFYSILLYTIGEENKKAKLSGPINDKSSTAVNQESSSDFS